MRFEDVLSCTVIGDGGWSKLSYKHSYNANAGVAIIFEHKHQQHFYLLVCTTKIVPPPLLPSIRI